MTIIQTLPESAGDRRKAISETHRACLTAIRNMRNKNEVYILPLPTFSSLK